MFKTPDGVVTLREKYLMATQKFKKLCFAPHHYLPRALSRGKATPTTSSTPQPTWIFHLTHVLSSLQMAKNRFSCELFLSFGKPVTRSSMIKGCPPLFAKTATSSLMSPSVLRTSLSFTSLLCSLPHFSISVGLPGGLFEFATFGPLVLTCSLRPVSSSQATDSRNVAFSYLYRRRRRKSTLSRRRRGQRYLSRLRQGVHLRQQTQIIQHWECPSCWLLPNLEIFYPSYAPRATNPQNKTHRSTKHARQTTRPPAKLQEDQEPRRDDIRLRKRRRNVRSRPNTPASRNILFQSRFARHKTKGPASQGGFRNKHRSMLQRGCGAHVVRSIKFVTPGLQAEQHVAPRFWKIANKFNRREAYCSTQGQGFDCEEDGGVL
jgi:hypothetical protein